MNKQPQFVECENNHAFDKSVHKCCPKCGARPFKQKKP